MRRQILILLLVFCSVSLGFGKQSKRLITGWEFVRQDLGGIWEAVRPVTAGNPENVPLWTKVNLPHCFNEQDAFDPDVNYHQGPGWYRTNLVLNNPYKGGRTLLHFEGAGQKAEVYIYNTKVGTHKGGYDEWTVDVTEAVEAFKKSDVFEKQFKNAIPFIRLAHYQQSPIVLNFCDSLGIMVWEEIPWCRGGLGGEIYKEQARRMLTNTIEQHYNHPAVIIWGLDNENDWLGDFPEFDQQKIRTFMKELNDLSHQLDASRKMANSNGMLIDNQGRSTGSRLLQLYNGRALIQVKLHEGSSTIAAAIKDLKTVFLDL
ncbi:Beta-galactosidase [Arcticibacter svalbardensis MN12-7]|uniref:Beta-galactosidase n=1 Tax=Arcticibacter svalbardensis MN12-7 TaxID=1150600 RepID=R9GRL4_9SPHI|nr:Beta-galactosidase [Arcticibacter svalbardensis MN12-7]